ncbi:MAG: hypothetical protein ABW163_07145 [Luteimonas sp.]
MSSEVIHQLRRQNRLLRMALVAVCLCGGGLVLAGAASTAQKARFTEIDVERINVRNPDGTRAMVLAGRGRLPGPVIAGKEEARDGEDRPGMAFYNAEGDEVGGLIYDGRLGADGTPRGGVHFSMDRYGGDQQVALHQYELGNGLMETGLSVYDRGLVKEYGPLFEAYNAAAPGPAKDALREQWKAAGGQQTQRLFVGRTRGDSSAVVLADGEGRPRIMMLVTPDGAPTLQFMSEDGDVIEQFPSSRESGGRRHATD